MMVYDATHIGTKQLILNMYRYGGLILTMCVMRGFSYTKGYIALTTYQLRSSIQMGSDRRGEQGADEASSPLGGGPGLENSMAGASLGSQVGSWSSGDAGDHRLFGMQLVCGRHLHL